MNRSLVNLCRKFNEASDKLHELMTAEFRDEEAIWRAEVDVRLIKNKLEKHLSNQEK